MQLHPLIYLLYVSFCVTRTESSGCNTDHLDHEANNLTTLTFTERTCQPILCPAHLFLNSAQHVADHTASCAGQTALVSVPAFMSCEVLQKLVVLSGVLRVFLGGLNKIMYAQSCLQ